MQLDGPAAWSSETQAGAAASAPPRCPAAAHSGREGLEQPLVPRPRAPRPVRPSRRDARLVPSYNVRRHRICFVGLVSADII